MHKLLLALSGLVLATSVLATDPIFTPWSSNLAIRGYDPVAYFTENKAVKGVKEFETQWQGATWRFASQMNIDKFITDPEAWAPQYGGYCAYAVAKNSTASIDPEQFSIVEGKLYLNYNAKVQKQWLADQQNFIEQADINWPALLNK